MNDWLRKHHARIWGIPAEECICCQNKEADTRGGVMADETYQGLPFTLSELAARLKAAGIKPGPMPTPYAPIHKHQYIDRDGQLVCDICGEPFDRPTTECSICRRQVPAGEYHNHPCE